MGESVILVERAEVREMPLAERVKIASLTDLDAQNASRPSQITSVPVEDFHLPDGTTVRLAFGPEFEDQVKLPLRALFRELERKQSILDRTSIQMEGYRNRLDELERRGYWSRLWAALRGRP